MTDKYIHKDRYKLYIRKKIYRIRLKDLQMYFNCYVFYFDENCVHEDCDEAIARKYEEQTLGFLRRIEAMLSVDEFLTISNMMIFVCKLPPGRIHIQG